MTPGVLVTVMIHIALAVPHAPPGLPEPWYCNASRATLNAPVPAALMQGYERELRRYGTVRDHFGFGTWTAGDATAADVMFEENDHVEVRTTVARARAFLPAFLTRMRRDLHQREALGEIIGDTNAPAASQRTRIAVIVPNARADYATLRRIHEIFGDRGNGGATQYDVPGGVFVYSGVLPASAPRIEGEIGRAGFRFRTEPETFVTAGAPPCR